MRRLVPTLAVFAAACLISSILPVAAWAAPSSPSAVSTVVIAAGDRVAVMAGGVALAVPVTYTCPRRYAGSTSWNVEVTEALPDGTVRDGMDPGGPGSYVTCDGRAHHTEILVLPPLPYRGGLPGTLFANILACTPDELDCVQPAIQKTVDLRTATADDPANQPARASARLLSPSTVDVTVPRGCPPGRQSATVALVWQRIPVDDLTEGTGSSTRASCGAHSTTIHVTSTSASLTFHRGGSYIYGYTLVCAQGACTGERVYRGLLQIR